MNTPRLAAPFSLASVDDYLGEGARRFFGAGYRRVHYAYRPVAAESTADGRARLETRLAVHYPADWSRKKDGVDLRPHLSTVDAVIIAAQAADLLLTHAYRLEPEQRRSARVLRMRIKAGSGPQEDLGDLPVRADLVAADPAAGLSTAETRVGTMRVRCEIAHPGAVPIASAARYAGPDELLGPASERYYGTGFADRAQTVRGVRVDPAAARAEGRVHFPSGDPHLADEGLEGRHQPFVGLVEAFVTTLQLGQILLYELDGVPRGQSNTLWMRGTALEAGASAEPLRDGFPMTTRLENGGLLDKADGRWRTADIVGELGSVSVRCSVAHRLP